MAGLIRGEPYGRRGVWEVGRIGGREGRGKLTAGINHGREHVIGNVKAVLYQLPPGRDKLLSNTPELVYRLLQLLTVSIQQRVDLYIESVTQRVLHRECYTESVTQIKQNNT